MTETKNNKSVTANMDPTREIRMLDAMAVHVLLTRIVISPGAPLYPSRLTTVKCFPIETWNALEKNPDWKKHSNWHEAKIISHPDNWSKEQRVEIEKYIDSILHPPEKEKSTIEKLEAELKQLKRKVKMT